MQFINRIVAVMAILFSCTISEAQFKEVAAGPSFKEDNDAFYKMLLLKDGSVFLFAINVDHGIDMQLYTPDHKMVPTAHIDPSYGKLKSGTVEEVFEINGDVVLMIAELDDKVPVLYRVVIDGKTGKLKSEDKIAEMRKLKRGFFRVLSKPNETASKFYVASSEQLDCYAVAFCDDSESGNTKNINIITYGADHKETKRARHQFSDGEQNSLILQSVNIYAPDKVNLLLRHAMYPYQNPNLGIFGKTTGSRKEKEMIAYTEEGSTDITLVDLPFSQDSILNAQLCYNPKTKKLVLAGTITPIEGKRSWNNNCLAFINPESRIVEKITESKPTNDLIEKVKQVYKNEYVYLGSPDLFMINDDGTITVVYEYSYWYANTSSRGTVVSYSLETFDVKAATYDSEGKLLRNYYVIKSTSHSAKNTFSYGSGFGNEFKKYFFFKGRNTDYILINDTRRNIEKALDNQPPIQIMGTQDCDAFYFPLTGSNVIPERKYMFGEGEKKSDRTMAALGLACYDKTNDLIVTIRKSNTEKFREINVVWLKPQ